MTLPDLHVTTDQPTTDPAAGFDLDAAVVAAADCRPWHQRSGWHDRAACAGSDPAPFLSEETPDELTLARCRRCPVRTQCAVDGLRMNLDGFLAGSADEICGGYGGLTPDEAWQLLGAIRAAADERGVALYERVHHLAERIVEHHRAGISPAQIADQLDATDEEVWDVLIDHFGRTGVSNRDAAALLGTCEKYPEGVSYKWVQRRKERLGCSPEHLAAEAGAGDEAVAA